MTEQDLNDLTGGIIGIAIEVHREPGSGLLEAIYFNSYTFVEKQLGTYLKLGNKPC